MSTKRREIEEKEYIPPSRKMVIRDLEMAMEEAKRKIESGRIYDAENEKVRIKWIKALGYLVNSYRQLIKDHDLEELKKRIEDLEEGECPGCEEDGGRP